MTNLIMNKSSFSEFDSGNSAVDDEYVKNMTQNMKLQIDGGVTESIATKSVIDKNPKQVLEMFT